MKLLGVFSPGENGFQLMSRIQPKNGGSPITYNQIQYLKISNVHRPQKTVRRLAGGRRFEYLLLLGRFRCFYHLVTSACLDCCGENTVGVVVVCKEERKHFPEMMLGMRLG